jgi:hypothetical protein
MGQDLLRTPTVAGYEPYRIAPDYDKGWYNTVSAPLRAKLVDDLFDPWKFTMGEPYFIDALDVTSAGYGDPNVQARLMVEDYLPFEWPIDQLNKLKTDTLLSGQAEDRYFTNAVNAYIADPNERNTSVLRERLKALYKTIFSHPEFQLQ